MLMDSAWAGMVVVAPPSSDRPQPRGTTGIYASSRGPSNRRAPPTASKARAAASLLSRNTSTDDATTTHPSQVHLRARARRFGELGHLGAELPPISVRPAAVPA